MHRSYKKINPEKLTVYVAEHPDAYQKEIAEEFGGSAAAGFFPSDPPVFDQMTRDFLYVLQLEGTTIALFSPATVVCPAKEFKQRIDLSAWLKRLQSVLIPAARAAETVEKANYIKDILEEFISELAVDSDQAVDALMYDEFYPAINRSHRREYEFQNFCCDFTLPDPNMSFLVERYLDDIFQDELLVTVYNRSADSMTRTSHIPRLDALFANVVELNGCSIIAVCADDGSVFRGQENFITTRQAAQPAAVSSFKNIIRSFCDSAPTRKGKGVRPFENGVVLFELPKQLTQLRGPTISFLNFEYRELDQDERRIAHNFIEQPLPQFTITPERNQLEAGHREGFFAALDSLRRSVFKDKVPHVVGGTDSPAHDQIDEFLRTESQNICDIIIQRINKM